MSLRVGHQVISAPIADQPTWEEFLLSRIDKSWRPGEFSFENQDFIPDPSNPHTAFKMCGKAGCHVRLTRAYGSHGPLCPTCIAKWKEIAERGELTLEQWLAVPRVRKITVVATCAIDGCDRGTHRGILCRLHRDQWLRHRSDPAMSANSWASSNEPRPVKLGARCVIPTCLNDQRKRVDVCFSHWRYYLKLKSTNDDLTLQDYVAQHEPAVPGQPGVEYSALMGIPFAMLPQPLRWEFIYGLQQRDLDGRSRFNASATRTQYKRLLDSGVTTVVGLERMGLGDQNPNFNGMTAMWQEQIDMLRSEFEGRTHQDRFVLLQSLELTKSSTTVGRRAGIDLAGVKTDWMFETIMAWLHAAPRHPAQCYLAASAWTALDQVIRARETAPAHLGPNDIKAFVRAVREQWPSEGSQYRQLLAVKRILRWAHRADERPEVWNQIPERFQLDVPSPAHRPYVTDDGEAFRYVPQPIIDWMMDHLTLFTRHDNYSTAEFRALIYVLERTGRRTGEIVKLEDDCISFDSAGAPYLEWKRGKPPYGPGPRLPLHQETYEVIRDWREIKRERFPDSQWLFPSRGHLILDRPYPTTFLQKLVFEFTEWIVAEHPYHSSVEGATGNLIDFNIRKVDPYSFRHAFAQRMADATDADGNSTTPPHALQEFMGHANFNTTMAYYQITSRRMKHALQFVPARRLDFSGRVVAVDRERDQFNKIAVSHGSCSEPQNVLSGGHGCALNYACESCPFFLVDPLEKDGMRAKRDALKVQLERARIINTREHMLLHYEARIEDCDRIIDGIDDYIASLPADEARHVNDAIDKMADIRLRAMAPRRIDIRQFFDTKVT